MKLICIVLIIFTLYLCTAHFALSMKINTPNDVIYTRYNRKLRTKTHSNGNYVEEYIEVFKTNIQPPLYDTSDTAINKFLLCASRTHNTEIDNEADVKETTRAPKEARPTHPTPTPNYENTFLRPTTEPSVTTAKNSPPTKPTVATEKPTTAKEWDVNPWYWLFTTTSTMSSNKVNEESTTPTVMVSSTVSTPEEIPTTEVVRTTSKGYVEGVSDYEEEYYEDDKDNGDNENYENGIGDYKNEK